MAMTPEQLDEKWKLEIENVSQRVRDITVAVLGLSWAFIVGDNKDLIHHSYFLPPIFFGLLALILDSARYLSLGSLYGAMRENQLFSVDKADCRYKVARCALPLEVLFAAFSIISFVAVFVFERQVLLD